MLRLLARALVWLIAVVVYLLLLPAQIGTADGLSIILPEFIRFSEFGFAFPEPINWSYVLWLPVPLLIVIIGSEIVSLWLGRKG
ncbi:MAG: hypothetical protein J7551_06770 [Chloroflexi bacterium]|nr:hypothetical protein [Chloroflexota bacterium]